MYVCVCVCVCDRYMGLVSVTILRNYWQRATNHEKTRENILVLNVTIQSEGLARSTSVCVSLYACVCVSVCACVCALIGAIES